MTERGTGPPIEVLLRRLIETPADFRAEPAFGRQSDPTTATDRNPDEGGEGGPIVVAAIVSDVLVSLGGRPLSVEEARRYKPRRSAAARNRLRATAIGAWLVAGFDAGAEPGLDEDRLGAVRIFLDQTVADLAELVDASTLADDPERREELARLLLRDLDLVPEGETEAQAGDRLTTLDSINRQRVMEQAREAERRAAEVRRALEEQRAAEAAAKASRE